VAARRPLVRKADKAAAVKLYNPRFEDDYVAGKDFDPDRCRAVTCWQGDMNCAGPQMRLLVKHG
jgi:hypothetical protein